MENKRTEGLLGKEALLKLKSKTVMVLGLGGVGSFCVEALARTGVGHLILVDHDTIELSNLNRQLLATMDTIGMPKTETMKERVHQVNPEVRVDVHDLFYKKDLDDILFDQKIDMVIDCIDSISSKKDLYLACIDRKIPFLSSMGMARKTNPSQLQVMELEKTSYDPLAKQLRIWKRKNKIREKIWVVSSLEAPSPQKAGQPLASTIFVPASAGLLLASEAIKRLTV